MREAKSGPKSSFTATIQISHANAAIAFAGSDAGLGISARALASNDLRGVKAPRGVRY